MTRTNVFDVSKYILKKKGSLSAMKLQKLIYYSQAWSLVWDDSPIFDNEIEAWANGPVCRDLYDKHRGVFSVAPKLVEPFAACGLDARQRETVDAVLAAYGDKTAQWLSDQTHSEAPWINARAGLGDRERGTRIITHEAMAEYYGNL